MNALDQEFLSREAERVGVALESRQLQQFAVYLEELKAWNKRVNLTSLQKESDILIKHFIDSLVPFRFIPPHSILLDIGTGAGFPGIPLKIAKPSLRVTLLDARLKKVFFLRHIIRQLGLQGIEAIHGRAEDMGVQGKLPLYDVVISRALYSLDRLQQVSVGHLKKGGLLIVLKTPTTASEEKRVNTGFRLKEILDHALPFKKGNRRILLLQKI